MVASEETIGLSNLWFLDHINKKNMDKPIADETGISNGPWPWY